MARPSSSRQVRTRQKRKSRCSQRRSRSLEPYTALFSKALIWCVGVRTKPRVSLKLSIREQTCKHLVKSSRRYLITSLDTFHLPLRIGKQRQAFDGRCYPDGLTRNAGGTSIPGSQCDLLRAYVVARSCLAPIRNQECASGESFWNTTSQVLVASETPFLARLTV